VTIGPNARLALWWLLNPETAPLETLDDDVQRIVGALSTKLPDPDVDAKTLALIEAHREDAAVQSKAKEIVRYRKADKTADRMILEQSGIGPSWAPVDIRTVLKAAEKETQTDVGYIHGDMPLGIFYRGKINEIHAESEAGKSWLACIVAVQEMRAGRHVAYIDFEDDAGSIARRMLLLGATREQLAQHLRYYSPTGPANDAAQEEIRDLVAIGGSLAIFDGLTESLALEGLDGMRGEDIAAWHARMTKAFAAGGWAVVVLDHVPHNGENSIGSQHKRSAVTGVSYLLRPRKPIGKGVIGKSELRVAKDRGAWVRAHSVPGGTPQHFADMVIDFQEATPRARLWLALPSEDKGYASEPPEKVCTAILAFVGHNPGASKTAIREGVKGVGTRTKDWAIEWLIDRAQLIAEGGGQGKATRHYLPDPD
jgi:hypothetical protein